MFRRILKIIVMVILAGASLGSLIYGISVGAQSVGSLGEISEVIMNPIVKQNIRSTIASLENKSGGLFSTKILLEIYLSEDDFLNRDFAEVFIDKRADSLVFWAFDISKPGSLLIWERSIESSVSRLPVDIKEINLEEGKIRIIYGRDWGFVWFIFSILSIFIGIMLAATGFAYKKFYRRHK